MSRKTAVQKKIESLEGDITVMNNHIAGLNLEIVTLKAFIKEGKDIMDRQKISTTIDGQMITFLVQMLIKERYDKDKEDGDDGS